MKRGPISAADKDFLIKNKTKTLKFLSKKLERSEESIQGFLSSLEQAVETKVSQPIQKAETPISTSLARNKKYGAVVMTPTASMISDEKRKARSKSSNKTQNFIHIMNPTEE